MILSAVEVLIKKGASKKLALFIRHGEKINDSTGLLSENGIQQSIKFGRDLCKLQCHVHIYSSPEPRCVQTANLINNELSYCKNAIVKSNVLGQPGAHISNNEIYQELYKKFKCREIYHQWKNGAHYDALRSPEELKNITKNFILQTCTNEGVTLYVSQSGTVAGMGYALSQCDYDVEHDFWIEFLDGFCIKVP